MRLISIRCAEVEKYGGNRSGAGVSSSSEKKRTQASRHQGSKMRQFANSKGSVWNPTGQKPQSLVYGTTWNLLTEQNEKKMLWNGRALNKKTVWDIWGREPRKMEAIFASDPWLDNLVQPTPGGSWHPLKSVDTGSSWIHSVIFGRLIKLIPVKNENCKCI